MTDWQQLVRDGTATRAAGEGRRLNLANFQ